jgi:hypothetical protein
MQTEERFLCSQFNQQEWTHSFYTQIFATDLGTSCRANMENLTLFHENPISFVPLEQKVFNDNLFSKVENKEKIEQILRTHSLIKKKKEKVSFA